MRDTSELHFEPFVHLADLTHDSAMISWGGFYFHPHRGEGGDEWLLLDDEELDRVRPSRKETMGERSEPYGEAVVEVFEATGQIVAAARTREANFVRIRDLRPDTEYRYVVRVDGQPWAEGERHDWVVEPGRAGLRKNGRAYDNRFRTYPAPDADSPLAFAVLSDFGIGIRTLQADARRQSELARSLERVVDAYGVRLILTAGDNVYLSEQGSGDSGHEDDDWYFSFYQPYRYILNRIPFYPAVGNHDSSDTEKSDDRGQLEDNYYLSPRFAEDWDAGRSSIDPGLFYTFRYGAQIEFTCIDTTLSEIEGVHYFELPGHRRFLESALPKEGSGERRRWRIPFSHHPPYCAGPLHDNMHSMIETLVPLFRRSGVRVVVSGHEHNFQYSIVDGIHYFITGSGGKLRPEPPRNFEAARTRAWAVDGHFLLMQIEGERLAVTPFGEIDSTGSPKRITIRTPDGRPLPTPIVIRTES